MGDEFRGPVNAEFAHNIGAMRYHRVLTEAQLIGDVSGRFTIYD